MSSRSTSGLTQGRKCFYTTPIKALSNQKYADLVRRHGADRVGLLTGDVSVNSEAPVVVMTTEVLRNMIYANSSTLANLGYVVMDEVHYLADRFRGAVWEEVIIGLAESIQVIALSATVSNAEEFGEWLSEVRGEMAVVVSERRPVPLFQHVLVGRTLYDLFADVAPTAREEPGGRSEVNPALLRVARDESRFVRDDARRPRGAGGRGRRNVRYGSGAYGGAVARRHGRRERVERLGNRPRSFYGPDRPDVVDLLDRADLLPAIVFIFSRAGCDAAVRQLLASGLRLTSAAERAEIADILDRRTAGLADGDLVALEYDRFAEAMLRGVAAHHAGLLPAFKECVEEAFVRGLVKVVFATETLALGINMPARSVVLEKLVKFNGESHADITPGEYTQLTGRAGRRGIDVEGHAVVLWQPGLDPRAVAGLASRRTYPLRSSFVPTYNMAVNLVGSVGRERARVLLEQSFAQFQSDRSVVGVARALARNTEEIETAWAEASCERGDIVAYARLRAEIAATEGAGGPGTPVGPAGRGTPDHAGAAAWGHRAGAERPEPGLGGDHRSGHPFGCRDAPADGADRGSAGTPAVPHRLPEPAGRRRPDADREAVQSEGAGLSAQPGGSVPVPAVRARPRDGAGATACHRCRDGRSDRGAAGSATPAPVSQLSRPRSTRPVRRAGAAAGTGECPARGADGQPDQHDREPLRPDLPGADLARIPRRRRTASGSVRTGGCWRGSTPSWTWWRRSACGPACSPG